MNKIEFELKILNIEKEILKKKLKSLNVEEIGILNFRRYVYDFSPVNKNKWIRLRTDGVKSFLTIKEILSNEIDGTHELEIEVSSFDTTHHILEELGYTAKSYQENKRESYILNGVNIEIDTWPHIPSYVEIEGESEEAILSIANALGYTKEDTTSINTKEVYKLYDIDLEKFTYLVF